MPARNIVVVCSGSHEKKVNLGEVFQYSVPIAVGDSDAGAQHRGRL
jgi:hypothetical protein